MPRLIIIALVAAALTSLSGCSFMGSYMNSVSTKHDGSSISNGTTPAKPASDKKCNQWCHNGWCSMHCEEADNSGN